MPRKKPPRLSVASPCTETVSVWRHLPLDEAGPKRQHSGSSTDMLGETLSAVAAELVANRAAHLEQLTEAVQSPFSDILATERDLFRAAELLMEIAKSLHGFDGWTGVRRAARGLRQSSVNEGERKGIAALRCQWAIDEANRDRSPENLKMVALKLTATLREQDRRFIKLTVEACELEIRKALNEKRKSSDRLLVALSKLVKGWHNSSYKSERAAVKKLLGTEK